MAPSSLITNLSRASLLVMLLCLLNAGNTSAQGGRKKKNVIAVKGNLFFMDGKPFDMWGIRVASASQSDELTDHLIAQLDDYYRYGINTIDVFFQGSSGGFSDPFLKNGKQIQKDHLKRMKRIIEACKSRGMVTSDE